MSRPKLKELIKQRKEAGDPDDKIWQDIRSDDRVVDTFKSGKDEVDIKGELGLSMDERDTAEYDRRKTVKEWEPFIKTLAEAGKATLKPIQRAAEVYGDEQKQAKETLAKEWEDPSWKSLYRAPSAALQYAFSPLTAVTRAGSEAALKDPLMALGVPEQYAQGAATLGEIAADFAIPFGPAKKVQSALPEGARVSTKTMKPLPEAFDFGAPPPVVAPEAKAFKVAKEFPEVERPAVMQSADEIATVRPAQGLTKATTEASEAVLKAAYDKDAKLYKNIVQHIRNGDIQIESLPEVISKHGITPEQWAQEYARAVSESGRELAMLSQLKKRLNTVFKDNPEALGILDKAMDADKATTLDNISKMWQKVDNPRRALLVSQLSTAMRNAMTQGARTLTGAFDDAMQTVLGGGSAKEAIREGLTTFGAMWNRLTPSGRERIANILESDQAAISKARLLGEPIQDVFSGKGLAYIANTFNRVQEYYFRNLGFETKLTQLLRKEGKDISKIDPKDIPEGAIKEATNYALEMTFSKQGEGLLGTIVRNWSKIPFATTVNPFPRFNWANAIPFILEHSPLGFAKALGPKSLEELASGNPEKFAKAASRATLGTLMFESAWQIRQSKMGGSKWYQINMGEPDPKTGEQRVLDVRAYAPFSTYLFLAEAMMHPENVNTKDYAEMLIGLNRIAGTGLVFVDMMRTKSIESVKDMLGRLGSAFIGSYTVPVRQVKDVVAGVTGSPEDIKRETRLSPVPGMGPLIGNIPGLSQGLPERVSPITGKRQKEERPILKQFTGALVQNKSQIEDEMNKVGLEIGDYFPKSGLQEANYEIAKQMGPIVDKMAPVLFNNPKYKDLGREEKRLALNTVLKVSRETATEQLISRNPKLALRVALKKMNKFEKDLIEKKLGIKFEDFFTKE